MKKGLDEQQSRQIVQLVVRDTSVQEKEALLLWAQSLQEIRNLTLSRAAKARKALQATLRSEVVWPILRNIYTQLKRTLWDNRSWQARLGLGGSGLAALAFGGQGAGIAALGTAIGVPLWLVIGAGGTLLGTLIDEVSQLLSRPWTNHAVPESRLVRRELKNQQRLELTARDERSLNDE